MVLLCNSVWFRLNFSSFVEHRYTGCLRRKFIRLFFLSFFFTFLRLRKLFISFHLKLSFLPFTKRKLTSQLPLKKLVRQPFLRLNLKLTGPTIYIFVDTHIKGVKISRQTNNSRRMKNETLHKNFKIKYITGTKRQSNKQKNREIRRYYRFNRKIRLCAEY